MVKRCVAGGCSNTATTDVSLHYFPVDTEIRAAWTTAVKLTRDGWDGPTKHSVLCSEHFPADCFKQETSEFARGMMTEMGLVYRRRRALKVDAIPTIFVESSVKVSKKKSLSQAVAKRNQAQQEALRNFDAALEHDRLIICHSPTSDHDRTSNMSDPVNPTPSEASDCSVSESNILQNIENPEIVEEKSDHLQVKKRYAVNEKQLLRLFSSQCPVCKSNVKVEKVFCGVVFALTLQCPRCGYSKEWKNLDSMNIPAADDAHQTEHTETTLETGSDSITELDRQKSRTSNTSVPVKPTQSNASDCSMSENNIRQNIENPEISKKKADHLQVKRRYVVNEKQLLKLFSSQCPGCKSKVNKEKVVSGVVFTLTLQCPQCGYSKEWRNVDSTNLPAADDQTENTETTLETVSDGVPELVYCVGEENDQMDSSDVSGDESDSDEDWDPENELFFDEELQTGSDSDYIFGGDDDDDDDNVPPRDTELCTDCGAFFKKNKPHTCEHIVKPLSCNACGRRFMNETALRSHSKIHSVSYERSCKCCHMKFKTKADKTAHEQNHLTEEKPYKCTDCSETFETYHKRLIHLKIHRGPEELKCQYCGLEFYRIERLRRHLVVHTGEKPYTCVVCKRGFNQAGNLKSHMRLHTGEKPFRCQHCYQGFNHNVSLKSHIQRYHTAGSECQQKKTKKRNHDSGDSQANENKKGTDSCLVESEQDTDKDAQLEKMYRRKTNKDNTGRPKGRPKRNKVDGLSQAEETQEQGSDTNT